MLAILSLAALQLTADHAAEVRLRPTAMCSSAVVRLADVADVVSSDPHLARALAEVPLCAAPAAGSERSLNQQDLRELLAISGVERSDCRVSGSDSVTVTYSQASTATAARYPIVATGVRQAVFVTESKTKQSRPAKAAAATSSQPAPQKPASAAVLVERGSVVSVIARAAGVRITATGKALEAGSDGQAVQVELTDTKQRVLAYVNGPQSVELKTPGL